MISTSPPLLHSILVPLLSLSIASAHIPTLPEITLMNDPVLNEVFAQSNIAMQPNPMLEDPIPMQPEHGHRFYVGEVPINHPQVLGEHAALSRVDAEAARLGGGLGRLAASSADVFYRGAASVGHILGIQPHGHIPLLSHAAGLLG